MCDGVWDCPQGTDEASTCLVRDCTGMFSCPHSLICILASSLCDSISDCPLSHDEIFCDVRHCLHKCDCVGYMIHCENLTVLSIFYKINLSPYFYIAIVRSKLDIQGINFHLYLCSGQKFRNDLVDLLSCPRSWICKKDKSSKIVKAKLKNSEQNAEKGSSIQTLSVSVNNVMLASSSPFKNTADAQQS